METERREKAELCPTDPCRGPAQSASGKQGTRSLKIRPRINVRLNIFKGEGKKGSA